jgi:FdrA protein
MALTKGEIRSGVYYDSVILMQLQRALSELPGVIDAGVIMGTDANKELLEQSDLLAPEIQAAGPDDMLIVVKGEDETAVNAALENVDALLAARRSTGVDEEFLPKSLETAAQMLPDAGWVLVSVPGRYAAGVTRQALALGKHVFLYSDNVTSMDEIQLKEIAAQK